MKPLARLPAALTPLAIAAAALAILVPSGPIAARSDLLLAALVLATALGIPARRLAALRAHAGALALLSFGPLVTLTAAAWLLGHAFGADTREGLLAVGLSSSEVAAVGLAALAGADATIALGALAGSLVVAAVVGPVAIGWLAGAGSSHAGSADLLGRFALVVLAPLAAGVALRSVSPPARWLDQHDDERDGVAALTVAALVYAALSGTRHAHGIGSALVAALALLAISAALGELWRRRAPASPAAVPGALAIGMRDFAVAAALADQAFGAHAATVAGIYGVAMLLAGSLLVARIRASQSRSR